MTRYINADALKELFIQVLENIKSNPRMTGQEMHIITAIHTIGQMIDDAPTIIPAEGGRVMDLNNPKTLDEAIEIIKEINPEYEETNTRTAETMVLCAVKDGELVDKHTIDAVPKWIPCSERLPEIKEHYVSETYLVCLDNGAIGFSELEENIFGQVGWSCEREDDYHEPLGEVIAWMPLPEPYEVKE